MNRRGFLKAFLGASAGVTVAAILPWTSPPIEAVTPAATLEAINEYAFKIHQQMLDNFFKPSPFYRYLKDNKMIVMDGGKRIKTPFYIPS